MILNTLGFTPSRAKSNQMVYKSPFNPSERTPSFFIFPNTQTGEWTNWKDYASGAGGDHYKFVMDYFQIDFKSAKEKIKEIMGESYYEPKQLTLKNHPAFFF